MTASNTMYIGCATWQLPKGVRDRFSGQGIHLERYGSHFNCVEINSTFYQHHKPSTFKKWASSVAEHFRFAVKLPQQVTHKSKLTDMDALRSTPPARMLPEQFLRAVSCRSVSKPRLFPSPGSQFSTCSSMARIRPSIRASRRLLTSAQITPNGR